MNSDTRTTGERVAQPATAGEAAGRVAEASKQQAGSVVDEVKDQTRNLVEEARTEATDQTRQQRDRAVQSLRSLGQELRGMADRSEQKGTGAELARQGAQRLESVAGFLQDREPGQVWTRCGRTHGADPACSSPERWWPAPLSVASPVAWSTRTRVSRSNSRRSRTGRRVRARRCLLRRCRPVAA